MTVTQRRPQTKTTKNSVWTIADEFLLPPSRIQTVRVYFDSVNCLGCVSVRASGVAFDPPEYCGFVNSLNSGPSTWPDRTQWRYYADFTPPRGGILAAQVTILWRVDAVYYPDVYYVRYWGADVTHTACLPVPRVSFSVFGQESEQLTVDEEPQRDVPVTIRVKNISECSGPVKLDGLIKGEYMLEDELVFSRSFDLIDEPLDLRQGAATDAASSSARALIRPANFVSISQQGLVVRAGTTPGAEWNVRAVMLARGLQSQEVQKILPTQSVSIISPSILQRAVSIVPRPVLIDEDLRMLESFTVTATKTFGIMGRASRDMVLIVDGEIKDRAPGFRQIYVPEVAESILDKLEVSELTP